MGIVPISEVFRVIPSPMVHQAPGAFPIPPLEPMSFMETIQQSGDYYESFARTVKNTSPNWGMLLDLKA